MTDPAAVAHDLAAALTAAWNAGDADAFAARFAPDAEFINIFGMLFVGREAVAAQHRAHLRHHLQGQRRRLPGGDRPRRSPPR